MIKVTLKRPGLYTCGGIRLFPGVNLLEEDAAKKMLENPGFKHRKEKGIISVEEIEEKKITKKDIASMTDVGKLREISEEGGALGKAADIRLKEIDEASKKE